MTNRSWGGRGDDGRAQRTTAALTGHDFSPESLAVVTRSRIEAEHLGDDRVEAEHVLLAVAFAPAGVAADLLAELGLDRAAILDARRSVAGQTSGTASGASRPAAVRSRTRAVSFSRSAKLAFEFAMRTAADRGESQVLPEHLALGAIATGDSATTNVIRARGISLDRAEAVLGQRSGATQQASLQLTIDDNSDRSIFEQIVSQIQERIATSALRPGDRLPAIRQMADSLDVAPGTVARAYAELEHAGVVITDGARGTRVALGPIPVEPTERMTALSSLLRQAVVSAFHLGATAGELRAALDEAMRDILPDSS